MPISNLFKKPTEPSYLKAGLLGNAGSGKTYTAAMLAVGISRHFNSDKPILFLDTEGGSDYIYDRVVEKGKMELLVAKTRAFSDLLDTVQNAESDADIIIIDSITHYWEEFKQTYLDAKQERINQKYAKWNKKGPKLDLTFPDWAYLKKEWGKFTTAFLNSKLHIIMCGRLGYEYSFQENDKGQKELIKDDIKMKTESETGYEPSLLIKMERLPVIGREDHPERMATVLKDRFGVLDGKSMINPNFNFFKPHIELLKKGGEKAFDETRKSSQLVDKEVNGYANENNKKIRDIIIDEIKSYLELKFSGSSKDAKEARLNKLFEVFGTASIDALITKSEKELKDGYNLIKSQFETA